MKKSSKVLALLLASAMGCSVMLSACKPIEKDPNENPPIGQEDKLAAPASLSYQDGKLVWSAVTGATSYEVVVTKGSSQALKQTVTTTELSVASLEAGDYTASVKALADGKQTSDAKTCNFTVAAELQRLATPTGFNFANGKVVWTAVEGATAGYLVKVTDSADKVAIAEQTVNSAELDVSSLAAGTYSISVTAKEVAGKALASLPATYSFTVEATTVRLATPTGGALDVEGRKVTWTAVPNAEEYEVTISADGDDTTETVDSAEISVAGVETDTFTVTVVAKADGYDDSEPYVYTAKVNAIALAKVNDLLYREGVLSWKHAGGADHFHIVVKQGSETKLDEESFEPAQDEIYSFELSELPAGEYVAEVYAIADEFDVFRSDSAAETVSVTIESLGAYQKVENIRVEGPYLTWDENNAQDYEIKVTEKEKTQALELNGVKVQDGKFNFLATGLPAGDYTFSVTPKDGRHTGEAETSTFDIALQNVVSYDAEAIARFDGSMPRGEHGKVELVTENGTKVAKLMPTVDGWGRIASPDFSLNYDNNPVVHIAIEEVVLGGYHLQVQIGGLNYIVVDDSTITGDTYKAFVPVAESDKEHPAGITGVKTSFLRLGVDHSTNTAANDAETHFAGLSVWYLNEWTAPFEGKLEKPEGFEISNGMEVVWNAVENADSYNVTVKKGEETILTKTAQNGVNYVARDLAEGEYTITVSAINSQNEKAEESDEATYQFKVEYLAEYTPEEMATFTNVAGDDTSVHYDEENGYAIFNYEHKAGWGAYGPATGVEVNLINHPFAYVDIEGYEADADKPVVMLARGAFNGETLVLRNDTTVDADSKDDLYIELWKRADRGGEAVTGTGAYRFGLGYTQNTSVFAKLIRIVQITEVEVLTPGAKKPLAAPFAAKETDGVLKAELVKGNSEYTPTYNVTVTEKTAGTEISEKSGLSEPSVNLGTLGLANGKTYVVSFKAVGDNDYFVDSEEYKVEVLYTEALSITDFSTVQITDRKSGDNPELTLNDQKELVCTTNNPGWGYRFIAIDLTEALQGTLTKKDFYMQWTVDLEASDKTNVTIATRFLKHSEEGEIIEDRGTGYGDSAITMETFLTKQWGEDECFGTDKNILNFAFGMGGGDTGTGESTKKAVLKSIKFVKFTVSEIAD